MYRALTFQGLTSSKFQVQKKLNLKPSVRIIFHPLRNFSSSENLNLKHFQVKKKQFKLNKFEQNKRACMCSKYQKRVFNLSKLLLKDQQNDEESSNHLKRSREIRQTLEMCRAVFVKIEKFVNRLRRFVKLGRCVKFNGFVNKFFITLVYQPTVFSIFQNTSTPDYIARLHQKSTRNTSEINTKFPFLRRTYNVLHINHHETVPVSQWHGVPSVQNSTRHYKGYNKHSFCS